MALRVILIAHYSRWRAARDPGNPATLGVKDGKTRVPVPSADGWIPGLPHEESSGLETGVAVPVICWLVDATRAARRKVYRRPRDGPGKPGGRGSGGCARCQSSGRAG